MPDLELCSFHFDIVFGWQVRQLTDGMPLGYIRKDLLTYSPINFLTVLGSSIHRITDIEKEYLKLKLS